MYHADDSHIINSTWKVITQVVFGDFTKNKVTASPLNTLTISSAFELILLILF